MLAILSAGGCALMSASLSHVTTPVRRHFVSESEARESLDRYFDAAETVVTLYDDDVCHANCLASYFENVLYILPAYPESVTSDPSCKQVLE